MTVKPNHDLTVSIVLIANTVFPFAVNGCSKYTCTGNNQQCEPKSRIAVISCLRAFRIISFRWLCLLLLNLKIRAAFTVCIDNREIVCADRERVEVIGFQCDNRRAGDCRIILRINQRSVHLYACEFAEITVCTESPCSVTVLRPCSVCTLQSTRCDDTPHPMGSLTGRCYRPDKTIPTCCRSYPAVLPHLLQRHGYSMTAEGQPPAKSLSIVSFLLLQIHTCSQSKSGVLLA